jgi:hypothetical protein
LVYAVRHDNLYKKVTERRDTSDVTELIKVRRRIINEAIATETVGDDLAEGLMFDLRRINLERPRDEFPKKVRRKATAPHGARERHATAYRAKSAFRSASSVFFRFATTMCWLRAGNPSGCPSRLRRLST